LEREFLVPTSTVGELAELVGGEVIGDPQIVIHDARAIDKAGAQQISFIEDSKNFDRLQASIAAAVVIPQSTAELIVENEENPSFILVDNAQEKFLQIVEYFRPLLQPGNIEISEQSYVSPSAIVGSQTRIAPFAVVEDTVILGDNCDLHSGAYIGPGCRLGNNVTIHANVVIYPKTVIEDNVIIHASSVIGADGFGYRMANGRHEKLPHYGNVRIERDVEIGACTTIDRSMIDETIIGEGTKIDNLVMVAHNCELGKHNIMVGQVGLAGSVTSGDYVVCAGQAGVADHTHLGDQCVIASRSAVAKDVPAKATYLGTPAVEISEAKKSFMAARRLPEMRKTVRELEKQVAQLTTQIAELLNQNNHDFSSTDDTASENRHAA
jgi:UDP-3-O-[3-hydroxymyristoyl] glucosamine N-acyltransferase